MPIQFKVSNERHFIQRLLPQSLVGQYGTSAFSFVRLGGDVPFDFSIVVGTCKQDDSLKVGNT